MSSDFSSSYKYDQKEILRAAVLAFVKKKNVASILDIGAGSTDTALCYSKAVNTYYAVEHDRTRGEFLRRTGLTVSFDSFPCRVPDSYELVLCSHSIPEDINSYEDFITRAWELVLPSGYLMIITFKGVVSSVMKIYSELRAVPLRPFDYEKFETLIRILATLGEPQMTNLISTECSNNPVDIAKSICTSLGEENGESMRRVTDILEERFKVGGEYRFPHEHNVIVMRKARFGEEV